MTAQMDLFNPTSNLTTAVVPGLGEVIESVGGAWRAQWFRWGWCLYRRRSDGGWDTWEPDLPYGQAYITDRLDAEHHLEAEIARYGDKALDVSVAHV